MIRISIKSTSKNVERIEPLKHTKYVYMKIIVLKRSNNHVPKSAKRIIESNPKKKIKNEIISLQKYIFTPLGMKFSSNCPFEDLNSRINLALNCRCCRNRRRIATGDCDLNSVTNNPNFELLRFDFPNFRLHFRFQLNLDRQILALGARFQRRNVGSVGNRSIRVRNHRSQTGDVVPVMGETGKGSVADVDIAGDYPDRDLVVEEGDFAVTVTRDESDVEGGGHGGVGEVEFGELEGGDGEGRAVRAV